MPKVSNDEFLTQLRGLFEHSKTQGSVYLEQKRLTRTGPDSELHATSSPFPLVFRASNGTRQKRDRKALSTVVDPEALPHFWQVYADTLKKGAAGLRKKEKKEKRKAKK